MQVNTYLNFNGNCEAALKFYAEALNGTIDAMMPHEGTPAGAHVPADWRSKILHASMTVGSTVLMGSDAPPDRYQKPQGFSVSLQVATPEEAERAFQALSKVGTVRVPIQQTLRSFPSQ
jgi:PhnB protein